MPALTLRGRYLMREYWSDTDLFLRLTAEEREFYMGLWMLADDDGWLPRDVAGIGAALYSFEDRGPREAKVRSGLSRLRDIGKLKSLRCGCVHLPVVTKYPRAGNKNTDHAQNHAKHQTGLNPLRQSSSNGFDDVQAGSDPSPVPSSPVLSQPVAGAQARGGDPTKVEAVVTEFQKRVGRPA